MPGQAKPHPKVHPDIVEEVEFAAPVPILERPDGYYWQAPQGQADFGPYESYELAQASRDAVGDESESLREAESDIGINEWIDAETGLLAEGQSPPHLEEV